MIFGTFFIYRERVQNGQGGVPTSFKTHYTIIYMSYDVIIYYYYDYIQHVCYMYIMDKDE